LDPASQSLHAAVDIPDEQNMAGEVFGLTTVRDKPAQTAITTSIRNSDPANSSARTSFEGQRETADTVAADVSHAAERARQAQDALDRWGLFGRADKVQAAEESSVAQASFLTRAFHCSRVLCNPKSAFRAFLLFFSVLLIATGVVLQKVKPHPEEDMSFKWLYFFGAIWPLCEVSHVISSQLFHAFELLFFQEFLAHFDNLVLALERTLAAGLVLIWERAVLSWIWCRGVYEAQCQDPNYETAELILRRIAACALVATIASLLAAALTKHVSTKFYSSTHFKKLHDALDQEYQLRALSRPQMRRRNPRASAKPRAPGLTMANLTVVNAARGHHLASCGDVASSSGRGSNKPSRPQKSFSADNLAKRAQAPSLRVSDEETRSVLSLDDSSLSEEALLEGTEDIQLPMEKRLLSAVPLQMLDNLDSEVRQPLLTRV